MAVATQPNPELVSRAIAQVNSIATLPEVTAQIIKTVEDPNSSAASLHKIISHDPALVTRVLKVVNSSFYGLPGQIASVERATVLLGVNAIKNLAIAASLGQMFRGSKLCDDFSAKDLWTHCVAVAVIAREIAKTKKLGIADEAFLAGMVHDVGMLVALQVWPEKLREVCDRAKTSDESFIEVEQQIMGVDHQQLGEALAKKWQFPKACQNVAGHHHQPLSLGADISQVLALVHVADVIAARANIGFNLSGKNTTIAREVLDALDLGEDDIDALTEKAQTLLEQASAFA